MTCDWHRHTTWVSDVSFFLLAYDWSFCSDGFIRLPTSLNIDEYSIIIYIGISSYIGMSLLSWWLPWIWICRANLDAAKTWNGLHALCLKHEHRVRARPQMWPKWDCFSHDLQLHWGCREPQTVAKICTNLNRMNLEKQNTTCRPAGRFLTPSCDCTWVLVPGCMCSCSV